MSEFVVHAELKVLGVAHVEANSLEDAKEKAIWLDDEDFELSWDDVDGPDPVAIYEANEAGFANYSRPHLERKASDVEWERKQRGV